MPSQAALGLNAGCCTGMAADFVGVSFCFCAGGEGTGDGLCVLVSDLFSGALAALIAFPAVSADLALSVAIVFEVIFEADEADADAADRMDGAETAGNDDGIAPTAGCTGGLVSGSGWTAAESAELPAAVSVFALLGHKVLMPSPASSTTASAIPTINA